MLVVQSDESYSGCILFKDISPFMLLLLQFFSSNFVIILNLKFLFIPTRTQGFWAEMAN